MGVVKVPEIRLYWSKDPMFSNERIKNAMTRQRFMDILQYWHFCDDDQDCSENRLYKISTIVEMMNENFRKVVKPGKELVIDESLVPWRGRLKFRQYIPNKRHKYGIKLYKLNFTQGYTYKIKIYSGKNSSAIKQGHAQDVVMELMNNLLYDGRILYTDSYYTSIPLARELLQKETCLCGTVRANRSFLPVEAKIKQKRGDIFSSQKEGIKFMKWTDKRPVLMLTTCQFHKCSLIWCTTRGHKDVQKPDCVLSYNVAKKGVDIADQMASYYS